MNKKTFFVLSIIFLFTISVFTYADSVYEPGSNLLDLTNKNISNLSDALSPYMHLSDKINVIYLSDNNISDLSALKNFTKLEHLYLENNNITDITPLSSLTNLSILKLDYNNISDITPLSNLHNLVHLSLCENKISNISSLSNLRNLIYLNIENNNITDITPLSNLTSLEQLRMQCNNIRDISPVASLKNLEWIWFPNNKVTDISPLKNLPKLEWISCFDNQIDFKVEPNKSVHEYFLSICDPNTIKKIEDLEGYTSPKYDSSPNNIYYNHLPQRLGTIFIKYIVKNTGEVLDSHYLTDYKDILSSNDYEYPKDFLTLREHTIVNDKEFEGYKLVSNDTVKVTLTDDDRYKEVVFEYEKSNIPIISTNNSNVNKKYNSPNKNNFKFKYILPFLPFLFLLILILNKKHIIIYTINNPEEIELKKKKVKNTKDGVIVNLDNEIKLADGCPLKVVFLRNISRRIGDKEIYFMANDEIIKTVVAPVELNKEFEVVINQFEYAN